MSDHEPVIHCPPTNEPYSGNYVVYERLQVSQSTLDGMMALINWCDGFQAGGKGRVPGAWELCMFYRSFRTGHKGVLQVEQNVKTQARLGRAVMLGYRFKEFISPCSLTKDNPGSIQIAQDDEDYKKWEIEWPKGYDDFDWIETILNMAGVPS